MLKILAVLFAARQRGVEDGAATCGEVKDMALVLVSGMSWDKTVCCDTA